MHDISSSMMYVSMIAIGLIFFVIPSASAHVVPGFSITPDSNYTDPVRHFLLSNENHPHIVIPQDSEFTLPMMLKSDGDNGTFITSYDFHVTNGSDFTTEAMPTGMSILLLVGHTMPLDLIPAPHLLQEEQLLIQIK